MFQNIILKKSHSPPFLKSKTEFSDFLGKVGIARSSFRMLYFNLTAFGVNLIVRCRRTVRIS